MQPNVDDYLFVQDRDEDERLTDQGTVLDPITRRLLIRAGLRPGWRVLDLGSGAGNLAFMAADLVGPDGAVVGVDRDAETVARARERASHDGYTNVEFRTEDVAAPDLPLGEFDAVIGRLVLMYQDDPATTIRRAAERVRSGGLICLQEPDMSYRWSAPSMPLWDQVWSWFQQAMTATGTRARMGHELYAAFRAAGLPDPRMNLESAVFGGSQADCSGWAQVVIGTLPIIERSGIATRDEVDPDTLAERMLAELVAHDGIMITGPLVGAWVTKP